MCGIAGFINKTSSKYLEDIALMCDKMVSRGPDGFGYWHDEFTGITLGHRRLSVLDLSENGKQPMVSASGRFVISFNGEIYNFQELKTKITSAGGNILFRGSSDTEVLVEAFSVLGIERTLASIRGMFAISLFDRQERLLYLIRDRMGEKPLYYGWSNNSLVFASNLDAIIAYCGELELEPHALLQFICYGYISGTLSIYKGIKKVLPGELVTISAETGKLLSREKYWDVMEVSHRERSSLSEEELTEQFETLLSDAIREQMVADVPVGAYLSGGVDSSLIVALMQKQVGEKVRTYTIGIEGGDSDEAPWARKVADALGVKHTVEYITKNNMIQSVLEMGRIFSEPFADVSQVPTYMVSKLAKKDVTVTLSGDAGDELFCGYAHYSKFPEIWTYVRNSGKYNPFMHIISNIGVTLPRNKYSDRLMDFKTKYEAESLEGLYRAICEAYAFGNTIVKGSSLAQMKHCDTPLQKYRNDILNDLDNLMLVDQLQYLPDDILVKVDCTGMAVSLENRIPLLDKRVIEFAWTVPSNIKYDGITSKKIMRNVLYKYVPKEYIERPKQGFAFPALGWLLETKDLRERVTSLFEKCVERDGILNKRVVNRLWKEYLQNKSGGHVIWNLVMLLVWADERNISL